MENNTKVDVLKWQISFVISAILPIIGIYSIQRTENSYVTGISPVVIIGGYCFGGFILLFGIIGAIYCLFRISRYSETIRPIAWITIFVIPILVWLLVVVIISIRPSSVEQLIFQAGLGSENFQETNMEQADLSSMDLFSSEFEGANLRNADLSFTNLKFSNLQGANLKGANLLGAELQGVNLYEAKIDPEQLIFASSLREATMPDGTRYDGRYFLGMDLTFAHSDNLNLCDPSQMARFYGITEDEYLHGLNWASNNLPEILIDEGRPGNQLNQNYSWVNMNNADLRNSNFYGAGLNGAIFSFANLNNADLSGSDLSFANMCEVNLRNAVLINSQVDNVDFQGADFLGADLTGSSMRFSDLTGANISDNQLEEVSQLEGTILPNGEN